MQTRLTIIFRISVDEGKEEVPLAEGGEAFTQVLSAAGRSEKAWPWLWSWLS